jgi:hypothetical protein
MGPSEMSPPEQVGCRECTIRGTQSHGE